jgi:hypothetical protein
MQNISIPYPKPDNPEIMRRIITSTVCDKFFTVEFVKSDGTSRKINGRLGVEKHKKGGRDCNDAEKYLTVFDIENHGYRNVNLDTITSFTFAGVQHRFVED